MKLLTKQLRRQLPPLYTNEQLGLDALALVKFFIPGDIWAWYASEFDGKDLFFGFVVGYYGELGYFSLAELSTIRGPFNLPVERDLHFKPTKLQDLQEYYTKRGIVV